MERNSKFRTLKELYDLFGNSIENELDETIRKAISSNYPLHQIVWNSVHQADSNNRTEKTLLIGQNILKHAFGYYEFLLEKGWTDRADKVGSYMFSTEEFEGELTQEEKDEIRYYYFRF